MNLRRLQYFAVLAQERHFRRAAARLHIAHTRSVVGALPDEAIACFSERHPRVRLVIDTAWTTQNLVMLRAGEVGSVSPACSGTRNGARHAATSVSRRDQRPASRP